MNRILKTINREEVLYYLNCPTQSVDPIISTSIDEGIKQIIVVAKPRLLYKVYSFQNNQLVDCSLHLQGKDIQQLLSSSSHVMLVAATLGSQVDQMLRITQIKDMGKAFIFDQCANAAIEQVIQDWEEEVRIQAQQLGWYLSDRYSPGYGDLSIHIQKDFLKELDTQRKIGLHVNESNLLMPCKSITAIIGLSTIIQPAMIRGCSVCALRDTCQKRKEGNPCVKE